MPNWIRNELQAIGSFEELLSFRRALLNARRDHNALNLMRYLDGVPEENLYSYDDALDGEFFKQEKPVLYKYTFCFDSLWSPPLSLLQSVIWKVNLPSLRYKFFAQDVLHTGSVWIVLEDSILRRIDDVWGRPDQTKEEQRRSDKILDDLYRYQYQGVKTEKVDGFLRVDPSAHVSHEVWDLFLQETGGLYERPEKSSNPFASKDEKSAA